MATLFFSYSHADEDLRDQLELHLSALRRQGVISAWHDRRILAGSDVGNSIDEHIDHADVILLLISPNFIDSDYCYEREMMRALQRHSERKSRVIPVILRPCDWHDLKFGKLLATPTDGRPITMWPNTDQAFLNVVMSIKAALHDLGQKTAQSVPIKSAASSTPTSGPEQEDIRSSNLRITKTFSDLDKDKFRLEGFAYIAKFFENSLSELVQRNPGLEYTFRRIDADIFTAALYRGGVKTCKGSVRVGGSPMGRDGIEYAMTDEPRHGGMNEAIYVKANNQSMYFEPIGMQSFDTKKQQLSFEGAAELFWSIFIRPLQD